jgi:ATP synthase F1 delta subunit
LNVSTRMIKRSLFLLAALMTLAFPVLAAEAGGSEPSLLAGDVGNVFWTILIFVLVLVVLGKYAWGPILKTLQARETFIHEALAKAKADRDAAEGRLREYEERLATARAEATAIVEEGRRDAEAVKRKIEEEAKHASDQAIERAKREIQMATDAATKDLYRLSAKLATDLAARVIGRELTSQDHDRLIAEVGRLYAEAMLHVAEEKGQSEALLEELDGLVAYMDGHPEFERFLTSPLIEEGPHGEVLEKAFRGKASDLLVDSLLVINRKGRLASVRAIALAYRAALRDLRGWVDVRVRTAVPLTPELRARLTEVLAAFTGRRPTLVEKVDPGVIGGLVVQVEGRKIDASVASRLHDLSTALASRAAREIHSGKAYVAES